MNRTVVLHVEDDANDVTLVQHACRKAGGKLLLHAVADGDEAISYLSGTDAFTDRQRFPVPELVLLDLKMPRVNGFEVLGWVRQNPSLRRLPVIILTSSNHEADVKRAYDLGANSYLVKPVGFEALVELMRTIDLYWGTLNEKCDSQ